MDLSGLLEVKRQLHEATKFSTVWDYFLTHFGERPEFMKHGELVGQDELLQAVIVQVCKMLFEDRDFVLVQARLIRIAEYHFVHGSLRLDSHLGSVLYFEDDHKGLLCITWDYPETKYVRFTGRALYDALSRSQN